MMVDWSHLANVATVISLGVGLVILFIAYQGFLDAKTQLGILADQAVIQNERLKIESERLITENQAAIEFAHQNIMEAYAVEKNHRIDVSSCSYYPTDEKIVFELDVTFNTEVDNPNSNWLPSKIPFEVKPIMHGKIHDKESQEIFFKFRSFPTLGPSLINPSQENEFEFSLYNTFEDTKDLENTILYVRTQYFFAPYSLAKNAPLSDPIEQDGHLLVGLEENEDGRWLLITGNENIIC